MVYRIQLHFSISFHYAQLVLFGSVNWTALQNMWSSRRFARRRRCPFEWAVPKVFITYLYVITSCFPTICREYSYIVMKTFERHNMFLQIFVKMSQDLGAWVHGFLSWFRYGAPFEKHSSPHKQRGLPKSCSRFRWTIANASRLTRLSGSGLCSRVKRIRKPPPLRLQL